MAQAIRIDLLQISRSHIVQLRERVGQRHLGFEVVTDPRRMFTTLARLTLNSPRRGPESGALGKICGHSA